MPTFQYGNSIIDYTVTYKPDKKDITVSVDWEDGVTLAVPFGIDHSVIEKVVHQKAPWILKKLHEFSEINSLVSKKEFLSGEKFPYLGRNYRLKVFQEKDIDQASLTYKNGRFFAHVNSHTDQKKRAVELRELFKEWYIIHGHDKIKSRLRFYCPKMECYPTKLIVKEQQYRWGSCTKNGTININWKILMAPMRIVDYVVVHELAHLEHPNHSSAFWAKIQSVLPDYEQRKEWLRIHGPTLDL